MGLLRSFTLITATAQAVALPRAKNDIPQVPLAQQRTLESHRTDAVQFYEAVRQSRVQWAAPSTPDFTIMDAFTGDGVPYAGLPSFAHLPFKDCFSKSGDEEFDIGVVGMPFDLGVSYRPGARFGPGAIRMASRRLLPEASYDMDHKANPFKDWATIVDCGDIANTPFDKLEAMKQLSQGAAAVMAHKAKAQKISNVVRMITLGGDHTITLPLLRAIFPTWGPVAVLHFDSHLDTWDPKQMNGGSYNKHSAITHGTMLHLAHEEGLMSNDSNMHLGSRSMMFDESADLNNDVRCGFDYVLAREIDELGVSGIVERTLKRVGGQPVYISIDIDVLDPAFTPATGTIEPGGWSTREVIMILRGLANAGVKIIGADLVELTPVYDNKAETSALVVTELVYELLHWMVKVPVDSPANELEQKF